MGDATDRWRRRCERAKARAEQAEALLEAKSRALYESNYALQRLANELEQRVRERTEELRQARDEALAADRAKSAFLANMTHELRTPLSVITGYAELLDEIAQDEGLAEFSDDLGRIRHASKHLLDLVNDILDLSKVDAGRMSLELEQVDVPGVIEEVVALVARQAEINGNELVVDVPATLPPVRADRLRLKQCVLNLASNAVKFTSHGRVWFDAARQDAEIRVQVGDTGIGMSDLQRDQIFQPFAQAESSTTKRFGGTGLGLALTRRLLELMHGRVELVHSEPSVGSTFAVWVPLST